MFDDSGDRIIDLLFHMPERIMQRKFVNSIAEIGEAEIIIAKVKVMTHNPPRTSKQPYVVTCYLGNNFVSIVFYKYFENYIESKFKMGSEVFVSGKVEMYNSQVQIIHPDYVCDNLDQIPQLEPIYPLTAGLTNREVGKNIVGILNDIPDLDEWLDEDMVKTNGWCSWKGSLCNLHRPAGFFDPKNCAYLERLAFDELLAQQIALSVARNNNIKKSSKTALLNRDKKLKNKLLDEVLQFKLTEDQVKVMDEIEADTFSDRCMLRLLQGDVGSGKTIVALLSMLNYVENQEQCVLMVPTTILATQHFANISSLVERLGVRVELLTSNVKGNKRKEILAKLKNGDIDIIIGTHAIIEENIEFKNLGFTVIDEQHRFGVEQRLMLINKNRNMDILTMTATPIPRTLALTLYSDIDLSIINSKPIDRKQIITALVSRNKYSDLIDRMKAKIKNNEKIYWICPLVWESENTYLTNVKTKYEEFCSIFGEENVAFIHGKMSENEKDSIMEDFCNHSEKKILVSTTVIEVGIDVKDATVIVIEHPERFGLSQLHQLRGRVGRGDRQSFCILLHDEKNSQTTLKRLNIMRTTDDGFAIAEQDLKIRGIGEVVGSRQSGMHNYQFANLNRDFSLLGRALDYTKNVIKNNEIDKYNNLLHLFSYANYINDDGILN